MGYNATVVVMVDALADIESDPNFGKKLVKAIRMQSAVPLPHGADVSAGGHVNAATVLEVQHADRMSIMAIGGNTGRTLAYGHWRDDNETLVAKAFDKLKDRS